MASWSVASAVRAAGPSRHAASAHACTAIRAPENSRLTGPRRASTVTRTMYARKTPLSNSVVAMQAWPTALQSRSAAITSSVAAATGNHHAAGGEPPGGPASA